MLPLKCKYAIEDDKLEKKSRENSDSCFDFEFTFVLQNREEKPQCVVCSKAFASESMLPEKLERHLTTLHPQFANKPEDFFV